ncbi:MAG: hypothetical protein KKA60_01015 [Proteobacteria bacterium]|nr:hypothetical protein [Pseudomonadota bacterium]
MEQRARIGGIFEVVCLRPDGLVRWSESIHNLVTSEGLDHLLNALLHGSTQVSPWYVGLKNTGSGAAGDTLASHAGWTENSAYSGGSRPEYVEAAASGQSVTNSASRASFAINTDGQTIAGAFLASVASGTSGTLLCVGDFSGAKSCGSGDTVEVTYTLSAADDGV